ncbi:hypothetical protein [Mucilaginibacter rubeus]|uniref:hypothetical protein n=1 Tax=Mucilaginibacter rubeus TaxID=2027860 RepID=UPI00166C4FF1|nr:hypothetical protein [Mucilaginibacter rubeus]
MKKISLLVFALMLSCHIIFAQTPVYKIYAVKFAESGYPFNLALVRNERLIWLSDCIASGVINANPGYALVANEREMTNRYY